MKLSRIRKRLRLPDYDYSSEGAYFVTICTQNRQCLFSNITDGEIRLNEAGKMNQTRWQQLPQRFDNILLDEFIIMPNHVHGIIKIAEAGTRPAPTLGAVIGVFKSITTHDYILNVQHHNWPPFPGKLWQRNYYEHIIRNESELNRIRQYILDNPINWDQDPENIT